MQYSKQVRNAQNDAAADAVGPAPVLEIRTGPPPASCDAPDQGVLVARGALPHRWMTPSVDGKMQHAGKWLAMGTESADSVPGGHFRIKGGGECHLQGTFGPGKEMDADHSGLISPGQIVTISQFDIARGNA